VNYNEYIKSPEWVTKCNQVKQRDGYRCLLCNSGERLEVHHRTYERLGNELPEDLSTLCHECHDLFSKHNRLPAWLLEPIDYEPIPFETLYERKLIELGIA
jgi:5-methylcytosine-specific restriction endonuclease McrA